MSSRSMIDPHLGVGQLRFGMAKSDIDLAIGPAQKARKTPRGESSELRGPSQPRLSIANDRLVEMSFLPAAAPLVLDGRDLFADGGIETLERVERDYGRLVIHVGFVVCLGAGLAFTGFHDGDEAQKAVTVFPKGRWDRFEKDYKPFSRL